MGREMSVTVEISVGPLNGRPQRPVLLSLGEMQHREAINLDRGSDIEAFLKRAARTFKLKPNDLLHLDQKILDAADQADEKLFGPISYPAMTCAELVTTAFVIRFYVSRILAAGQPLVFAGPKKAMKTTLLIALMLVLATGRPFLDVFTVYAAVTVGMMTGESGLPTIQETIRRIAINMGIDAAAITNLVITDKVPHLGDIRHLDAMREFITKYALQVLVIDPAYMAMSGADAGNLFVQGQILRGISELCQESGCTLILCHHTKRNTGRETYDPPELEDIAWAGFQEWARQWLLVGRRERYEPGSGEHRLWLTAGGSMGHSGRWGIDISEGTYDTLGGRFWKVSVTDSTDIREEKCKRKEAEKTALADAAAERDCEKVKATMARYPAGETGKTIRVAAGIKPNPFDVAISRLLTRCEIVQCFITKPNRKTPYDAYRLKDSATPNE
jgi:hypothetical protein